MPTPLRLLPDFGDYELIEEVGRGGMGVVYRTRQVSLGREVALKLMRDAALASERDAQRFRAEAQAAAALQHAGIVAIHEVGEHEGQHYIAMEFIAGRSLAELLRDGPLSAHAAVDLIAAVADAVQHAHDRGVLHRDLKPSNVLVDTEGRPHVTDFGLAKRFSRDGQDPASAESITQTGQVLGTPGFMSPEQASGRSHAIGPASDTYSLGALLYHALTGVAPFSAETPAGILREIEERDPISPRLLRPAVPRDLETICLKALAKDVDHRYSTARDFAEDLRRWRRGEPVLARPIGPAGRAVRWCRRKPVVAALTGATGLLLLLLAVGSLVAARRLEVARRAEAAGRAEAVARLEQGERLLDFLLRNLYEKLDPIGRLDVLEATIAEVEAFYARSPASTLSSEAKRHQARAALLLGRVRNSQGRAEEAGANLQKALQLYRQATEAQPTNALWLEEFSQAWNTEAAIHHNPTEAGRAEAAYREALRLNERLRTLEPANESWIDSQASMLHNLAALHDMIGRLDEAEHNYGEARRHWQDLLSRWPNQPKLLEHLAQLNHSLSFVHEKRGRDAEAAATLAEALRLRELLVQRDTNNMSWLGQLADTQQIVADRHFKAGRLAEAAVWMNRARLIREQLVHRDPSNTDWQRQLADAWRHYATLLEARGEDALALDAHQRAREIHALLRERFHGETFLREQWLKGLETEEAIHLRLAQRATATGEAETAKRHSEAADALRTERTSAR